MKIVGCDLHAKQQTIAMVDTETGEFTEKTLNHENQVREFYAALEGPVVVGNEATGAMQWFLELLEELLLFTSLGCPNLRRMTHPAHDPPISPTTRGTGIVGVIAMLRYLGRLADGLADDPGDKVRRLRTRRERFRG